ncbi:radical SAM protein [Romboutsia weinsteinii]|uniref:Radical SAM protein n=1 Tax=Romboutsia weinsteinii TaxID=2020949 RepID=A0A371J4J4_9FIRM|nr:radical SAM protein [Romboutsia weinsteinii]RDY27608.1 radical SAM protein [Romboutsia weinsteinii]
MNCMVWTTKSCNLNCRYCYEQEYIEIGHMSDEIENRTLDTIKEMILDSDEDIHNIQFHGGEPLLNFRLIKRFVEELEVIKGNSIIKYGMTTNGTIWNSEIEEFFRKYTDSFKGYISISIDGDSKTHNKNRVSKSNIGSFDVALDTSQKMLSIFKWLRCRVTVEPNTVKDLFNNIKYLIELGFKQISVAFDLFSENWNENHVAIIQEQYENVLKFWKKHDSGIEISLVDEVVEERSVLGLCSPSKHFYIDGLIYPCTFVVGSKEYSIGDIYNGINDNKVDSIIQLSHHDNPCCEKCNNKKTCYSNRCKLINKMITGDYYTPPTINCVLENIQICSKNKLKDILELL